MTSHHTANVNNFCNNEVQSQHKDSEYNIKELTWHSNTLIISIYPLLSFTFNVKTATRRLTSS